MRFFCCHARQCTMARNSPILLVPPSNTGLLNTSVPVATYTPRYSILPGLPEHAASTAMAFCSGFGVPSGNDSHDFIDSVSDLVKSGSDLNADSAASLVGNPLYFAPGNPSTCRRHSSQLLKTPICRPVQTV